MPYKMQRNHTGNVTYDFLWVFFAHGLAASLLVIPIFTISYVQKTNVTEHNLLEIPISNRGGMVMRNPVRSPPDRIDSVV